MNKFNKLFIFGIVISSIIAVATLFGAQTAPSTEHILAPQLQTAGASCGSRALLTACAIEELINEKILVTESSIRERFMQKIGLIRHHQVEAQEIEDWNDSSLHLPYLFIFQQATEIKPYAYQPSTWSGCDSIEEIYKLIENRLQKIAQKNGAVHFIYNTGGHWVLVSYIKQANQKPRIIYIDSVDSNPTTNSTALFIKSLCSNLIKG